MKTNNQSIDEAFENLMWLIDPVLDAEVGSEVYADRKGEKDIQLETKHGWFSAEAIHRSPFMVVV